MRGERSGDDSGSEIRELVRLCKDLEQSKAAAVADFQPVGHRIVRCGKTLDLLRQANKSVLAKYLHLAKKCLSPEDFKAIKSTLNINAKELERLNRFHDLLSKYPGALIIQRAWWVCEESGRLRGLLAAIASLESSDVECYSRWKERALTLW